MISIWFDWRIVTTNQLSHLYSILTSHTFTCHYLISNHCTHATIDIDSLTTGCSIDATGQIVKSQGGKQSAELSATSLHIVGTCPGETYPLAKKRHSLEYLCTIAHLRPLTNTIAAVSLLMG